MSHPRLYEMDGVSKSVSEWCATESVKELGITEPTFRQRLGLGWDVKKALTEPVERPGRRSGKASAYYLGSRKPTSGVKISIYLDAEAVQLVDEEAKRLDRSFSWVVQRCIQEHVAAKKASEP